MLEDVDTGSGQARLDVAHADGPSVQPSHDLTDREVEVLSLIAAGWSNQQIADALFISRKTASVHASHIFDKLGAANRIDAAAIARNLGIEPGGPPQRAR